MSPSWVKTTVPDKSQYIGLKALHSIKVSLLGKCFYYGLENPHWIKSLTLNNTSQTA